MWRVTGNNRKRKLVKNGHRYIMNKLIKIINNKYVEGIHLWMPSIFMQVVQGKKFSRNKNLKIGYNIKNRKGKDGDEIQQNQRCYVQ